jgi:hypothetical protein
MQACLPPFVLIRVSRGNRVPFLVAPIPLLVFAYPFKFLPFSLFKPGASIPGSPVDSPCPFTELEYSTNG